MQTISIETSKQAKEAEASTYKHLQTAQIESVNVSSFEAGMKALDTDFATEVIECEMQDLSIDNEGFLKLGGELFVLNIQSLKALCKLLKVPFTFGSTIPAFAFETILTDFKLMDNKPIKLNVKTSTMHNKKVIVNIIHGKANHQEWLPLLQSEIRKNTNLEFLNGQVSDSGFQFNFVPKGSKSVLDKGEYVFGKSIVGDNYLIRKVVNVDYFIALQNASGDVDFATFGNYVMRKHGLNNKYESYKFKISNEKAINGDEKKGKASFAEQFKDAWVSPTSSFESNFAQLLEFANNNNVSLWKLLDVRSKLTKIFQSSDATDAFFGFEKDQIEAYKAEKEEFKSSTPLSELDKKLKQTQTKSSAKLMFEELTHYSSSVELSEYLMVNTLAISVLIDTFNHFNLAVK